MQANIAQQDIVTAFGRVCEAVARVEETGVALIAANRKHYLLNLSLLLEDMAPCPRPNLAGWVEVTIDELKESGAPEGMTPAEALKAAYLAWIKQDSNAQ